MLLSMWLDAAAGAATAAVVTASNKSGAFSKRAADTINVRWPKFCPKLFVLKHFATEKNYAPFSFLHIRCSEVIYTKMSLVGVFQLSFFQKVMMTLFLLRLCPLMRVAKRPELSLRCCAATHRHTVRHAHSRFHCFWPFSRRPPRFDVFFWTHPQRKNPELCNWFNLPPNHLFLKCLVVCQNKEKIRSVFWRTNILICPRFVGANWEKGQKH